MSQGERSRQLFRRACRLMPGGVSSPVRAFRSVGGEPLFIASAAGCRLTDADGREYLDYVGSWGPLILGHADSEVVDAICRAAAKGTSYGAPCAEEVELAEVMVAAAPHVEMVRFVSSGTEAVMSAVRLARRVLPNAASCACFNSTPRISSKNAMSLGFDAAKPPSM